MKSKYLKYKSKYLMSRGGSLQQIDLSILDIYIELPTGEKKQIPRFRNLSLVNHQIRNEILQLNRPPLDLHKCDFRGIDLSDTILSGANLKNAILNNVFLTNSHLTNSHLEGADLRDAHLEGADLQGAHLEGADLKYSHLEGADLRDTHLEGADLRGADLRGARLDRANLRSVYFEGTDLQGAYLYDVVHLDRDALQYAILRRNHCGTSHLEDIIDVEIRD